ncbi:helix-turn-helix transcriptional regulator [Brevibacillus agri]|uniref:helix-turn-helix domain-containing protein n=1 Tax=Brevibacillus agri TaxID=51101 RepID=UPI002E226526|nr:helix-turn-helix transcriptional regulator [Brevibacillus agri]
MNPIEIGKRIQELRKKKYRNRAEFAEALQTSEGNVKRIENGLGLPSIDLLVRTSILLNTSTDVILFGHDASPSEKDWESLNRIYRSLSETGRKTLNNIGQELLSLESSLKHHRE